MIVPTVDAGLPQFAAEHAHPAAAVEWWFFQGHYEGPVSGRRYFMATLFRRNLEVFDDGIANGFELMLAVLDPDKTTAGHESANWIDRPTLLKAIEKLKTTEPHVDPVVQQAFLQEIEAYGPPHPTVLKPAPLIFEPQPVRVEWEDFALAQTDSGFELEFREPDSGRTVSLHLAAAAPRMDVACASRFVPLESSMVYGAYPRVSLVGCRDREEEFTGQAWMDHQWGDTNWFRDATGVMLGWEWFGINFEDGSDMLAMRHFNARSKETVAMHATFRAPGSTACTVYQVALTPLRQWSSPATFIEYPVAWRIEVPEFDAMLVFEPHSDDQEIASFGTTRAVWEGAGSIRGTMHGAAACGTARGEFHGYGYVFDHQDFVHTMGQRIDRHLEEFLPRRFDLAHVENFVGPARWRHDIDGYTEMFSVPVWDLIDRSGKRWRPIFGILMLEALGVPSLPYEGLISCMLEFIHAGALIIDDIEDNSLLRRGQQCIHLRYGVDVAINAGNALYFLPGAAVIQHPLLTTEARRRSLEIKERICIEGHYGQATDICWSRQMSPDFLRQLLAEDVESRILQLYAFKTASAVKGAGEFVAAIAGASPEISRACGEFGLMLGVAYQIVDDIHNFSRSPDWTKVCGEDLLNGKLTMVIAQAVRRLPQLDSARLQSILCSPELRNQPSILAEGVELVHRSGALELCREMAKSMVNEAWSKFSPVLRPTGPKIMLHTMCLKLIELAYDG